MVAATVEADVPEERISCEVGITVEVGMTVEAGATVVDGQPLRPERPSKLA